MSVLNTTNSDHTKAKMFLDSNEGIGMQRYDVLKYKSFDKLTDKQLGFFWRPEEIDVLRDAADFKGLTEHEQHIFTSNLKRQILLDSVQGRSPNLALLPLVTIPELETWIETWAFSETIHSRSYTHIIRNVYANPSKIFDEMMDIPEIIDCATDISKYYDDVIEDTQWYQLLGEGTHTVNDKTIVVDLYELKKKLYLCLMSVNILRRCTLLCEFCLFMGFCRT
jgi:ribonucleoside-diphosphate reductase beta chain